MRCIGTLVYNVYCSCVLMLLRTTPRHHGTTGLCNSLAIYTRPCKNRVSRLHSCTGASERPSPRIRDGPGFTGRAEDRAVRDTPWASAARHRRSETVQCATSDVGQGRGCNVEIVGVNTDARATVACTEIHAVAVGSRRLCRTQ